MYTAEANQNAGTNYAVTVWVLLLRSHIDCCDWWYISKTMLTWSASAILVRWTPCLWSKPNIRIFRSIKTETGWLGVLSVCNPQKSEVRFQDTSIDLARAVVSCGLTHYYTWPIATLCFYAFSSYLVMFVGSCSTRNWWTLTDMGSAPSTKFNASGMPKE